MRKVWKRITSLVLAVALIIGMNLSAYAANPSITYESREKFEFFPGSDYTDTDLFDNFKDVMPGDTLTEKITVKNKCKSCDYIKIYMRAVAHDENNPLTYDEEFENTDGKDQSNVDGQRDETVATMTDFLSKLTMTVKQGDRILFEASPDLLGGLKDNVLIAKLAKGAETELTVELNVPIALDNTYANRVGEVDWVFVVEERNNPSPEELEEPEEPEVYPYVPIIQAPKTGDSANMVLWIAVLAVAATTVICIRKKRKNQ